MDFPIQDLMDETACYQYLLDVLHPEELHCPRCQAREGFQVHRYFREPVLDYRCPGERSISFGSRGDPCCSRKCLPLKMVPASRLVVRT